MTVLGIGFLALATHSNLSILKIRGPKELSMKTSGMCGCGKNMQKSGFRCPFHSHFTIDTCRKYAATLKQLQKEMHPETQSISSSIWFGKGFANIFRDHFRSHLWTFKPGSTVPHNGGLNRAEASNPFQTYVLGGAVPRIFVGQS